MSTKILNDIVAGNIAATFLNEPTFAGPYLILGGTTYTVTGRSSGAVPFAVNGRVGQSVDLLQLQVNSIVLAKVAASGIITAPGVVLAPGAAPGSPVSGQNYYDSTQNQDYVYNGTTWVGDTDECLFWMAP